MNNKNNEFTGFDCMMEMDRNARVWATVKAITEYCDQNNVTWSEFDEVVDIINHYMGHTVEAVIDEFDENDVDYYPENLEANYPICSIG